MQEFWLLPCRAACPIKQDMGYKLLYVNGNNNLHNLHRPDQTSKIRLIEEKLHRLMFDVEDV
jgi:adenine-specific DNA-methyltransferase